MQEENIFRDEYLAAQQRLDRMDAILKNRHLSCADKCILMVVDRLYPRLVEHETAILVWQVAKEAGTTRMSVSRFFQAMHERHYLDYHAKRKKDTNGQYSTECTAKAFPVWKWVERLNTKDTPKRKEHRKKVKERLQCRFCQSHNVKVHIVAVCKDCGKEQE